MTTIFEKEVECCVCGEKSNHTAIGSTNSFGSSDLDTRPPEMERSTINYWIQRCPSCGYCASDLSKCHGNSTEIVESKEYKGILGNTGFPDMAKPFLAVSYEKKQAHQYSGSAWRAIHAAWICDDSGDYESSKKCREQAIAMVKKGEEDSQKIADQAGVAEAISIDLMRRSGLFQQALKLVEKIRKDDIEKTIMKVIIFEEVLIGLKDIEVHTVSEALEHK